MKTVTLAAATVSKDFPGDTVDPGFTFTITGTASDGTPVAMSDVSDSASMSFDLDPGTYVGQVSKLGETSLPSDPFVVEVPTTVTLVVPDATAKATILAA